MDQFLKTIQNLKPASILISTHTRADPDGVCGTIALKHLIKQLHVESDIEIIIESCTLITKKIIVDFNLDVKITKEIDFNPDLIILVDVGNIEIIGNVKQLILKDIPYIIVDHHSKMDNTPQSIFSIIEENYPSTIEVIYEIFEHFKVKIDKEIAKFMVLGIVYDTKHLLLASNKTFQIMNDLISKGIDYNAIIGLLRYPMSKSEIIARLKAGQRLRIFELDDWVCAFSYVSSYEASACRGLLNLGAELAIVSSIKKDEIRASLRSTQEFFETTKISLVDICEELLNKLNESKLSNFSCGGHSTAAGINGKSKQKYLIENLLKKILKDKISKISNNKNNEN
jgi:nanoRNase/pAp phosphatase (c-di-AMP/oligoRNAs hydrolase)